MTKTVLVICAVNMIASAVALFLIFRPAPKPVAEPAIQVRSTTQDADPSPPPEQTWEQFSKATTLQAAIATLSRLPSGPETLEKAHRHINASEAPNPLEADFAGVARIGACAHYLGAHATWDSPHRRTLQNLAQDRQQAVIVRDLALRAVVDIALRETKTIKDSPESASTDSSSRMQTELSEFLQGSDFGAETSIEGLALQAAVFARSQGIAAINTERLRTRIGAVLATPDRVQESTLLAALDVCAQLPELGLSEHVRRMASQPQPDAVLQAAISALAKIGTPKDREWLAQLRPASPALYRAIETTWIALTPTGVTPQ